MNSDVNALTTFDDGAGPALFAAGWFSASRGQPGALFYIAKWTGDRWLSVGDGLNFRGQALAVFDDGTGSALYVGGESSSTTCNCVMKWDGVQWTSLGLLAMGAAGGGIYAMHVFDDGAGPRLYAGGRFSGPLGGVVTLNIGRWDGTRWGALAGGYIYNGTVRAIEHFDEDGDGPAPPVLFVGGRWASISDAAILGVARWDSTGWSMVGGGLSPLRYDPYPTVNVLHVFDDGRGPALFAGGAFASAAGRPAENLARWNGQDWSAVGAGIHGPVILDPAVHALATHDDGRGPALYIGGKFQAAGELGVANVARWDGHAYEGLGTGNGLFAAMEMLVWDDGGGPALYVASPELISAGGTVVDGVARWDGFGWSSLGPPTRVDLNEPEAMCIFDDGRGPALYVTGPMSTLGGVEVNNIGRWDGQHWEALAGGLPRQVGPGSSFGRWKALAVYDDGRGEALYVGGNFIVDDPAHVWLVARWDGVSWEVVGAGSAHLDTASDFHVRALAVYDDGRGPALYASGRFDRAGGTLVNNIARWDGASWTAVGAGLPGDSTPQPVWDMVVHDDGRGSALIVAGDFRIGGVYQDVMRWDGQSWTAMSPAMAVRSLYVSQLSGEAVLYAGGGGAPPARGLVRWDGAAWSTVAGGVDRVIYAMADFVDARGPALYIGGVFSSVGSPGVTSYNIARLGCLDTRIAGDLNCDGLVNSFDIDGFVLAISDPAGYAAAYPTCGLLNADINADGTADNFDVDAFVECIINGRCP